MSAREFDLDDPLLTAYVLGELEGAERAAVESWLSRSEAGRQQVAELRSLTGSVLAALQAEAQSHPAPASVAGAVLARIKSANATAPVRSAVPVTAKSASGSRMFVGLTVAAVTLVGVSLAMHYSSPRSEQYAFAPAVDAPDAEQAQENLERFDYIVADNREAQSRLPDDRIDLRQRGRLGGVDESEGVRRNSASNDRLMTGPQAAPVQNVPFLKEDSDTAGPVTSYGIPRSPGNQPAAPEAAEQLRLQESAPNLLGRDLNVSPAEPKAAPAQNPPLLPESRYGNRVEELRENFAEGLLQQAQPMVNGPGPGEMIGQQPAGQQGGGQPPHEWPSYAPYDARNAIGQTPPPAPQAPVTRREDLYVWPQQPLSDNGPAVKLPESGNGILPPPDVQFGVTPRIITNSDGTASVLPASNSPLDALSGGAPAAPPARPIDPNAGAPPGGAALGGGGVGGGAPGQGPQAGDGSGFQLVPIDGMDASQLGMSMANQFPDIKLSDEQRVLSGAEQPGDGLARRGGGRGGRGGRGGGGGAGGGGRGRGADPNANRSGVRPEVVERREVERYRAGIDVFIQPPVTNESYSVIVENEFLSAVDKPFSTFGVDVDNGAYSNLRRFLYSYQLPPANAVRIEEMINAFKYAVPQPEGEHPVAIAVEAAPCPWDAEHQLVRVSLKGKEINIEDRPAASLVFLVDTSGSMRADNKLPLVQASLRLLVEQMEEDDRIAIVTYDTNAGLRLDSTPASDKDTILTAIDSLVASGSTNGEAGLKLAYEIATKNLSEEGTNRVLLCTDGDFNVGVSDDQGIFKLIEDKRQTGVFLTALGYGTGNLKDSKLEGLANRGNGHYYYIDQLKEAQRVLVQQLTGTLFTIAKDVKLQVEFNPKLVQSYRLIGYENRLLRTQDFNNDRVDAGDMGAGHTVTALYEIVPGNGQNIDASRYQAPAAKAGEPAAVYNDELLFVKLRYKLPEADESKLLSVPVKSGEAAASKDLKWAASVALFGMLARDSKFKGNGTWDSLLSMSREALPENPDEQRIEFIDMVLRARGIARRDHLENRYDLRELTSLDARDRAQCNGRYRELLDKFELPDDGRLYGEFYEYGHRDGSKYLQREGAPSGYWVYVYPHWYVWGEKL